MKLTPEIESWIDWERETRNRYPRNDALAKRLGCLIGVADAILSEYRMKHGDRVRGKMEGPGNQLTLEPEVVKVEKEEKKVSILDIAQDAGALTLAIVIDIILNAVVFFVIAPDFVTRIGMVCLSLIVVLFSLRGWVKGGIVGKSLWAMFALVATFSDISFALSATDLQAKTAGVDTELVRMTAIVDHDQGVLDKLQLGYDSIGSGFRSELAERQKAIIEARKAFEASSLVRREHLASIEKAPKEAPALTSDRVFSSIPDSVKDGRWIPLVFFSFIFLGLQLTILSSVSGMKKETT